MVTFSDDAHGFVLFVISAVILATLVWGIWLFVRRAREDIASRDQGNQGASGGAGTSENQERGRRSRAR